MDQNEDEGVMSRMEAAHTKHRENIYGDLPWKAWGSWFSWGSPVGLGLGWMLFIIPLGLFLLLLHQAGLLR